MATAGTAAAVTENFKSCKGTQAVAKALNCSKASVTKMLATLMDINLLVRERHGKST